jgi:hypothetical protein
MKNATMATPHSWQIVFTTDSSHLVSGTVVLNFTPPPDVFLKVMLGG